MKPEHRRLGLLGLILSSTLMLSACANLFDKDFAAGFAGLKAGELAKAPVKSRLGWHVVKLEGKRAAQRFADYNAWAPQFKQLLAQQKVQQYVAGLVKKAKVTPLK